jgi:D-3-phosphoglycerate dehydrogenase
MAEEALQILRDAGYETCLHADLDEAAMADAGSAVAVVVRSHTKITAEVMDNMPGLKVVGRPGAGIDNVDVEAATDRGIVVMNTPGGNAVSVAEHALALMLAASRDLVRVAAGMQGGAWLKKGYHGRELAGKTLALIGLGQVGAEVAMRARGLGMSVVAYDPFVSVPRAEELGVELLELDDALARGDIVSLHAPATAETDGLLDQERIARSKPGALLVNTGRGSLIDEPALLAALDEGRLAGAALDVFRTEPPPEDSPLLSHPKILATPHVAGASEEGQTWVGIALARQLISCIEEGIIINAVNFPSVPESLSARLRPIMDLGWRLGHLLSQLSSIRVEEVGLRYYGEWATFDPAPLTAYALAGVLSVAEGPEVTPVNARMLATERGIEVAETRSTRSTPFTGLLSVQLRGEGVIEWVEGTLMADHPRLTSLGGIGVEADLRGCLLVVRNQDVPGVVGHVGTELGKAGVNIAAVALGRRSDEELDSYHREPDITGAAHTSGPPAIGLFCLDQPAPAAVLDALLAFDPIEVVRQVELPPTQGVGEEKPRSVAG